MQFDDDAQLDPSQVEDVRAGGTPPKRGGGMIPGGAKGGGCLLLVAGIAALFLFKVVPTPFTDGQGGSQNVPSPAATANLADSCTTGAEANQSEKCRMVGVVNSIQSYWKQAFAERGSKPYTPAKTVLFSNAINTACGAADSAVGPFYCPGDRKVYLDLTFFQTLERDFGAKGGPAAQAYVVAHEYGHHVQNLLGTMDRVGNSRQGANSGAVRLELQADCYAGVWANNAVKTGFYEEPFSQTDIDEALSAAAAVGDDSIQKRVQGRVQPDGFTHGTSAQREKWFTVGYQYGDPKRCDTFSGSI